MILFSKEPVAIDVEQEKLYLQKLLGAQGCSWKNSTASIISSHLSSLIPLLFRYGK
jgi:hypothetical protein